MTDIGDINHSLGVERGAAEGSPSYDPDEPLDVDASHDWAERFRWMECRRCGVRDHWPAGRVRCKVPHGKANVIGASHAEENIAADLAAFFRWWKRGRHPAKLPSVDEWAANFHEWRMGR